jgi:N-acyl-L-homoserine lactone synthetase
MPLTPTVVLLPTVRVTLLIDTVRLLAGEERCPESPSAWANAANTKQQIARMLRAKMSLPLMTILLCR